jgi:hypothetical protein
VLLLGLDKAARPTAIPARAIAVCCKPLNPAQVHGYSDAKVANRNARVRHGATENGP